MATYSSGSSTVYHIKKRKDQLWSFMVSSEIVKDLINQQTLKEPKLMQLDKELYKWFTAVCSEGKPITVPMAIEKAEVFL